MQNFNALSQLLSHGVYVITVTDGEHARAFTAAWVMQASFEPFLLTFSVNPEHRSYAILTTGKRCSISVLEHKQADIAAHFGRSDLEDKMAEYIWHYTVNGVPFLADCLGYFECNVSDTLTAGDHELIVCKVINAELLSAGEPMLYRETGNMDGMSRRD